MGRGGAGVSVLHELIHTLGALVPAFSRPLSSLAYSLFGSLIQRPCDIQPIDALHGGDGCVHGVGRAHGRHPRFCAVKVPVPL